MAAHPLGAEALAASAAAVAGALRAVTVAVRADRLGRGAAGGSGLVWTADGTVVTNAHVVRGDRAAVHTADGRRLDARVVRRDDARDLAELRVGARDLAAADVGDSDALRPGEVVLALGHPLGVPNALSMGIVHSVGPHPTRLPGDRRRWVQADVRLAPGNSGGPLADARGRVVGVNSMIVAGLALAVPSRAVARFLAGAAARPRLGVTTRPAAVRGPDGAPALGLAVVHVAPGGSADDAGLRLGDVLVGAAGRAFVHPGELAALVADAAVGDRVALDVLRAGRPHRRAVTLRAGAAPGARAA
jgi:serine protease Do